MKKIHYINIGLPKAGTTFLYHSLIKHPQIDYKSKLKEFHYFTNKFESIDGYINQYASYDIPV